MGFDVIYLPPIHPIGEVNRKGPNNTLDPGPGRPRLAVGDRLARTAATTRSTPTSARSRTSTPSWRAASELGLEVALDLALQARARPPVGRPSTRSGSPPGPTAPSPTPRTRRRSTRTSTRSTSTTTPTASTREVLRVVRLLDDARRADLPRRQPAHQAGARSGSGCSARSARTDPDVLFLAEAFTRPAMMQRARRGRLPPVLHLLHLAQREVGARGVPPRGRRTRPAT